MKALRLVVPGEALRLAETEVPEPGAGEVRVAVRAAGICRSDVHYRAGTAPAGPLPLVPGHEVAGVVAAAGEGVTACRPGERVALHYLVTCGECAFCRRDEEAFCPQGRMLGKDRDGGYAEAVVVPAENAFPLPASVSFAAGAVAMCSAATVLHAFRKARLQPGETVAIFGLGGLGAAAVQIARLMGAGRVLAVEPRPAKRAWARRFGAEALDPAGAAPGEAVLEATGGAGAAVALELAGVAETLRAAVACLGAGGRAALVGLSRERLSIAPYEDLLRREREVVGVSDHRAAEIPRLLGWLADGSLDLDTALAPPLPLEERAVNAALDALGAGTDVVRSVIVP